MEIKTYNDIKISMIRSTYEPYELIKLASAMTMKKSIGDLDNYGNTLAKRLLDMGHTSILEHISMTFLIIGASRSFLAQVTRHRMGSFTSASQHYQNYSQYGATLNDQMKNDDDVINFINNSIELYSSLINKGIAKEEARQILVGGMENNLMWTINARSLINFFSLRLCYRNVEEIKIIAENILGIVIDYCPQIFSFVGADCYMNNNKCRQGKMSCGKLWERSK